MSGSPELCYAVMIAASLADGVKNILKTAEGCNELWMGGSFTSTLEERNQNSKQF